MSHTALARKYRPRRFSEVATQEHVSETLRRAVASGRVGHAYLFCGPRGVGKTTLARVLAMALNCVDRDQSGEPCGECESSSRIWGGQTALDVVEIDAASNRGVDDARQLRERAMYAPSQEGRYKVYIVDEAHMLTREAWNALLKILEEPPPRVIFVFATTEPQKIQQTAAPILSRCQRFDFRRIGVTDIVARLNAVLADEGLSAPEDPLRTIARKSDGGMRDALSLLDQVIALTDGDVTQLSVRRVLGLVESERYLEFLDILARREHGKVFAFVDSLLDEGYDLVEFYHGLVDALRSLLRLALGGDPPELDETARQAFRARLEPFQPADIVRMLSLASELESSGSLRRSANPQVLLEMLLLRLSYVDRTVSLEELLSSLGAQGTPVRSESDPPTDPSTGSRPSVSSSEDRTSAESGEGSSEAGTEASDSAEISGAHGSEAGEEAASVAAPLSAMDAWHRLTETGDGIPSGMRPFLRAAVVSLDETGGLVVELPNGPGLDRLREPTSLRTLEDALEGVMRSRPTIVVRDAVEGSTEKPARITPEAVRDDRLRKLIQREPLLGQAVEELDLELLD